MIRNKKLVIDKDEVRDVASLPDVIEKLADSDILRWYVTQVTADEIHVEATLVDLDSFGFEQGCVAGHRYPGKSAVVNVIPTGIGCEIGGYAGDAAPVTALLASCVDYLITNPNAVNASNFIYMADNVVYTEGYCIDLLCKGAVDLHLPYSNRVGLVIEKVDEQSMDLVFNILNTVRAVYGVEIEDYVITDDLIGGSCVRNSSGAYVGRINNAGTLLRACEKLIKRGVDAIAVTSNITDLPSESYAEHFLGKHPNPVGGAEAIISHLVCREFKVPSAHAPMINFKDFDLPNGVVDARGAGELVSSTGLACVLIGLRKAPQFTPGKGGPVADILNVNNLLAIVTPATSLGGIPVLYAQRYNIPVIAVHDNRTILNVTEQKLGLSNVIHVTSYAEAVGIVQALKHGISVQSISRPLRSLKPVSAGVPQDGRKMMPVRKGKSKVERELVDA
jgi:hypothetical protein